MAQSGVSIRVQPAIWNQPGASPVAVVRFVDPVDGKELFLIDAAHADQLIANIKEAVTQSQACAADFASRSPAEKAFMAVPVEGRA